MRMQKNSLLPPHPRSGRDGPLTPSPLTVPATMKDRDGEGVEDMGDGGSFAPPSPRNSLPSPCTIPVAARLSASRGRHWGFERHPPFSAC